jgi:hypothetical protein
LRSFKVFCLIFFVFPLTFAQQEPIVTDRPDITESSVTVPQSSLQIETGFVLQSRLEEINGVDINIRNYSILTTLLRYGMFPGLELRAAAEYFYQNSLNEKIEGLAGIFIGTKIQLVRDKTGLPDAALFIHLNLPYGNENLKPGQVEPEIILAASHPFLSDRFSLNYNIGGNYNSGLKEVFFFYSLSFAASLSESVGAFAEVFGDVSGVSSASYNFDSGLTYLLQPNFQIDISLGINSNNPADNWFISTGLAFRLPE